MITRFALALSAIALCTLAAPAGGQSSGELRFVLTGIDADRGGHIRCALYRNVDTWLNRSESFKKANAPANGSRATCVFRNVPAGTYAIAALHDADDDREMDQSLVGIPEEGYAISNDEVERVGAPDFDEARIQFDGTRKTTRAPMHY